MISHEEASELLGAYALHAVDADEVIQVEEHLDTCPRCPAELDRSERERQRWATRRRSRPRACGRASSADCPNARRARPRCPPCPRLSGQDPSPFPTPAPATKRKPSRGAVATAAAFAVAAAAVAVVLGIGLVQAARGLAPPAGGQPPGRRRRGRRPPVSRHQVIDLDSATDRQLAELVVVPTGGLPGLIAPAQAEVGRTYRLWGIVGAQPISLGLLGASPHQATFTMAGAVQPIQLRITAEPAGGSVAPTGSI